MLVVGPAKFGDVHYLGTVPALGLHELGPRRAMALLAQDRSQLTVGGELLCDAIVGTYAGMECRFLFDPQTGNMLVMEMSRGSMDDPCELHFADYAEIEGRVFPRQIQVVYGDTVYLTVKLADIKLEKAGEK